MQKCYICERTENEKAENIQKVNKIYLCESCREAIVFRSMVFKEKKSAKVCSYILGILGTIIAIISEMLSLLLSLL